MADKKKTGKAKDRPAPRPIRPFVTGVSLSAAWGAFHLPAVFKMLTIGGFVAKLVAIAIVLGGSLAALAEFLPFLATRLPPLLARLSKPV
jgi:hypothetical protein